MSIRKERNVLRIKLCLFVLIFLAAIVYGVLELGLRRMERSYEYGREEPISE